MNASQSQQPNPQIEYASVQSLPEVWAIAAERFRNTIALYNPHAQPETVITYAQIHQQFQQFATGLQAQGVRPETKIALFSDNSPRWMIADQGIMTAGAVDVVRSSQADRDELLYILKHSESTSLVVENRKTLQKLRSGLEDLPIERVILLSDEESGSEEYPTVLNYGQILAAGKNHTFQPPVSQNRDTLATLMYTSGTTGKPKGVMLTHGNLLHQVINFATVLQPQVGDRALSLLPSWHAYERSCEYFLLSAGCTQIYTNLRAFKSDLKTRKPHYMIGVPRLWESVYETIQKQLREQSANRRRLIQFFLKVSERYIQARRIAQGTEIENLHPNPAARFQARLQAAALAPLHGLGDRLIYRNVRQAVGGRLNTVISGGGSLAKHIDDFYEIIGIQLLVGYGLTETAPVTHVRRPWHNVRGTAGQPLPATEARIVDPETRQPLPPEEKGLVMVRGPQVMRGYYKQPEATDKVLDAEGWFDTGDLGWITPSNDLVLTGRAKDTIVLSNGENIEPQPIEDACVRSTYIDQIVVVGQDQRSLGALIVPNFEALEQWVSEQNLDLRIPQPGAKEEGDLNSKPIQELLRKELNREVQNRPGYRPDDRIGPFRLISEPFSVENGMLTQTLKVKRPVVTDRYRDRIDAMFAR